MEGKWTPDAECDECEGSGIVEKDISGESEPAYDAECYCHCLRRDGMNDVQWYMKHGMNGLPG